MREDLLSYFGAIQEIKNGLRSPVPDKPDALTYVEQMLETGHLLLDGALMDQPYIFMMEYRICVEIKSLFDAQAEAARKKDAN